MLLEEKKKISEVSEFSILPYAQNRKLGFRNLGKKFPRFPKLPSFRPGHSTSSFVIHLFNNAYYFFVSTN